MNRQRFEELVKQLFPDEKLQVQEAEDGNVKIKFNREIERIELGYFFSLGVIKIKRSGEGICATFDLTKADCERYTW